MGINSRYELSIAERAFQDRRRKEIMMAGVTLVDPDTVYFQHDTVIGKDSLIHPHVTFGAGVRVDSDVEILPYSRIEEATIATKAIIGPFAYIRKNSVVGKGSHVGGFREVKASTIGEKTMLKHFGYVGDSEIGDGVNMGAGSVTCNFDGFEKHKTVIGDGAFVGSNVSLIAPVLVGKASIIGAGSVVTESVEDQSMSVTRAPQQHYANGAKRYRKKRMN
jgi:bifunctional UDP-N-acetylglucosamine pyrophosphorylase/glucosamine-1-phosphate N-acetyltransferase